MELLSGSGGIPGFLSAWYGRPDRTADSTGVPGTDHLPSPLREWYAITAHYSHPVLFNCKVFPPDDLFEEGGVVTFCMDDFEYRQFGFASGHPDPVVLQKLFGGDEPWEPLEPDLTLSRFLFLLLVYETVEATRHGASADRLTPAQLAQLLAPLRRLPGPQQQYLAHYAGDGLLATAWPNSEVEGTWNIRLAARAGGLLAYAEPVPGVTFGPGDWNPDREDSIEPIG